jgi:hypothetical protein
MQQPQGDHLTGLEVGFGVFGDSAQLLIDLVEQCRDKLHRDHTALLAGEGCHPDQRGGVTGRLQARKDALLVMKPPRSKLRGITRKSIVCETPRFLTLFPLQGNLGASSEESPD